MSVTLHRSIIDWEGSTIHVLLWTPKITMSLIKKLIPISTVHTEQFRLKNEELLELWYPHLKSRYGYEQYVGKSYPR